MESLTKPLVIHGLQIYIRKKVKQQSKYVRFDYSTLKLLSCNKSNSERNLLSSLFQTTKGRYFTSFPKKIFELLKSHERSGICEKGKKDTSSLIIKDDNYMNNSASITFKMYVHQLMSQLTFSQFPVNAWTFFRKQRIICNSTYSKKETFEIISTTDPIGQIASQITSQSLFQTKYLIIYRQF